MEVGQFLASLFAEEKLHKSDYEISVTELRHLYKKKIITQEEYKNYTLQLIGVLPMKEEKEE
jgi:argininosuccinate lyase